MERISNTALQMLIGTYYGHNNINGKEVLSALMELQERRAEDKEIAELKHRMAGLEK